ncbi:MAG: hypothetical protein ACKO40_02175 [Planctomycetaceae bacterium]
MMAPLLHTWNLNLGYAKRLVGDCFVFVMAAHENMHLGQLSAWRRVQGMGRI